jgi:DNA-binding transcriptional regulator YiaG
MIRPSTLVDWRGQMGLTQGQMAKLLGVPIGTYLGWEQGRRSPRETASAHLRLVHWLWVKYPDILNEWSTNNG